MKQQQATWAPDDWKPRKGPHRLAPSKQRGRASSARADLLLPFRWCAMTQYVVNRDHRRAGVMFQGGLYDNGDPRLEVPNPLEAIVAAEFRANFIARGGRFIVSADCGDLDATAYTVNAR